MFSGLERRFLFDLSREVQDLMRVLVVREQEREARIRELEVRWKGRRKGCVSGRMKWSEDGV